MCYDVKTKLESGLKRAKQIGDAQLVLELEERLKHYLEQPLFHVSGFDHPELLVYTNEQPALPELFRWGLIPRWVKDEKAGLQLWNQTLNARGETIFEKPAFREAARSRRCLVYLDGFFEHHHHKGKAYPYFIYRRDKGPFAVAGLWDVWVSRDTGELFKTFSIVTTRGNQLLAKIHNNPKVKDAPRMPVILPEALEEKWLAPVNDKQDMELINELLQPYPDEELEAHTVKRLRGKEAVGNVPEVVEEFKYPELEAQGSQQSLF